MCGRGILPEGSARAAATAALKPSPLATQDGGGPPPLATTRWPPSVSPGNRKMAAGGECWWRSRKPGMEAGPPAQKEAIQPISSLGNEN